MDGVQVAREAFEASHAWFQGTVADITGEQANELPPGVAHPMSELIAHVLHSEDALLSRLRGMPPVWERDGWDERLDIPLMLLHDVESARGFTANPRELLDYAPAVYENTAAYLASIGADDLDREVEFPGLGVVTVAKYLVFVVVGNTFAHTGEISALKGIAGARGYPF